MTANKRQGDLSKRMEAARHWISENKLRAVGTFWGLSVGGNLAYQWSRPIPTSLKIIHSRVYAQALTLAALALAGVADVYEHRSKTDKELNEYREKLHALEKKFGHSSHEYADEVKEIEDKFGKGKAE